MKTVLLIILLALVIRGVRGQGVVVEECMNCLCETMSGCNKTLKCVDDVCGPFKITWAHWADAGKLTANGQSAEDSSAYSGCANDYTCATRTVQGYMKRFEQDCNGDGQVDCDDFVAIHTYGGYGCKGIPLRADVAQKYQKCKSKLYNDDEDCY